MTTLIIITLIILLFLLLSMSYILGALSRKKDFDRIFNKWKGTIDLLEELNEELIEANKIIKELESQRKEIKEN